jgi:hypothetical protein
VLSNLKVIVVARGDHMSTFQSPKFIQSVNEFLSEHAKHPATAAVGR